ncbi:Mannosylfructose-phosphate phosphatase [Candidatus Brocadiaceae bacterium]|nr:Mannosylfructose-phosphate phosphatase [Candidatus Brocadiaceae bacterium]
MPRLLICTDLDRTLLPNGKQAESPEARALFARLMARHEVYLAFVSGRHRALVEQAIADYQLPTPDWVIADVGSSIYAVHDDWQAWHSWQHAIAVDWQDLTAPDLQTLFTDLTVLTLQESEKQNRYKLSYYLPLITDYNDLQLQMQQRLMEKNLAANLIYSIDEAASIGLLDVLPKRANKLHAIEFLMQQQGFTDENTVFAGDSGNDLAVLISHIPSVLVANADDNVRQQAQQQANPEHLYCARGDFFGMNGNYSAGILEGIAHYHPLIFNEILCDQDGGYQKI